MLLLANEDVVQTVECLKAVEESIRRFLTPRKIFENRYQLRLDIDITHVKYARSTLWEGRKL
jgi:hypothetical protein